MDRAEERAGPEDVGDQALMRGLDTAFPFVRPGLSLSEIGRRSCDRPHSKLGRSPCRGPALASAQLMFDGARRIGQRLRSCVTATGGRTSEQWQAERSALAFKVGPRPE